MPIQWDKLSKVVMLGANRPPMNPGLIEKVLKALPPDVLAKILKRVTKSE